MSHQISLNLIYLRHCSFICQQEKKNESEIHTNFGEVKCGEGKN